MLLFETVTYSAIISFIANSFTFIKSTTQSLFIIIPVFVLINVFAGIFTINVKSFKLKVCNHGTILLTVFYISVIVSTVYHIILGIKTIPTDYMTFVWSALICFGVNFIVFWNGIISVYLTSTQLGIKLRVIGIICGFIFKYIVFRSNFFYLFGNLSIFFYCLHGKAYLAVFHINDFYINGVADLKYFTWCFDALCTNLGDVK